MTTKLNPTITALVRAAVLRMDEWYADDANFDRDEPASIQACRDALMLATGSDSIGEAWSLARRLVGLQEALTA